MTVFAKTQVLAYKKEAKASSAQFSYTSVNANITHFEILPLVTLNQCCIGSLPVTQLKLEQECRGRESNEEIWMGEIMQESQRTN